MGIQLGIHSGYTQGIQGIYPLIKSNIMASITSKRGNGRIWYAVWKQDGKNKIMSTGIPVAGDDTMTRAQAKVAAALWANQQEDLAKGRTVWSRAADSFRKMAQANKMGAKMPTVREYLTDFKGLAGAKTESNRKRAFKVFLEWLDKRADIRLDMLTKSDVEDFFRHSLELVSVGTVGLYRSNLASAFNKAVDDDLLLKSPMPRLDLPKLAREVNPELGRDKVKRFPFTGAELRLMIEHFPAPWNDMALIAIMIGGQRLGDVCCLRWDSIDFDTDTVSFVTRKTGKEMELPLHPFFRTRLLAIREEQGGQEEYVFPNMARRYMREDNSISTEFTTMLKTWGIVKMDTEKKALKGNRKRVSPKSFHSFRYSAASALRMDASISADLSMAIVGHDDAEIERLYAVASRDEKMRGMNVIVRALSAPGIDSLPPYAARTA